MEPSELEQNFDPTLRIYELTTLYEVSRVLLGSTSPEHLAFDVLTAAMGLTGSIWGVLWVATDDEGTFNCLRTCGQPMSSPEPVSLPYDWAMSLAERSRVYHPSEELCGLFSVEGKASSEVRAVELSA